MTDARFALRSLRKTPGFTAVAILTLALGIGANTAIFSLVNAVILKPLPYRDPSRLVAAWDKYPPVDHIGLSPTEFQAVTEQHDLFRETAWFRFLPIDLALTAPGADALRVHATPASANLFSLLGASAAIGRTFAPDEPANSAVLGDELWRTRFGGDRNVLGKAIQLDGQSYTVIGVMPAWFRLPDAADLWVPAGPIMADALTNPVRHGLAFVGRLTPGATTEQEVARAQSIYTRMAAEHPKTSTGWGITMSSLQRDLTGDIRPMLLLLLGAVALVLLIACANVANLLLSRASGRIREIAVRAALGAGAWRIVRQLLTESLLLSAAGAALGLVLARLALRLFSPVPASLDTTVLAFLIAVSLVTGGLFGLAPALQALRTDHNSIIKSGGRAGSGSNLLRASLVAAEFALAMVLVAGSGMLVRSFVHLMNVHTGFDPTGVLTMRLSVPSSRDPVALLHHIEDRVKPLPGFESVASVNALPLISKPASNGSRFRVPGSPAMRPDELPIAQLRAVSPDYFTTMRIPVLSGRAFTERDLNDPVVIINESFARKYWPNRNPVGEKFITGVWGPTPTFSTIVGVVGDVKDFGLDADPALCEYFPGMATNYLVVRSGAARSIAGAVRLAIRQADPDLPVSEVQTMDDVLATSMRSRRWTMGLLAAFASLALLLALVGIYGVMSWAVSQRTREIGIRMALGASSGEILAMVARYGLGLCGIGMVAGVAGVFALRRVVAAFVYGVSAADPAIYAAAVLLMVTVALTACYVPARRASRIDPSLALRWE